MNANTRAEDPPGFEALLHWAHEIGRDVIAPVSAEVDAEARFPREAFEALRGERLLSAYVPEDLGGQELSVTQICRICEVLGHYCASTAMIFAMHQIQVACIVHHGQGSEFFRGYLRRLVEEQLLLASATTELGVGGDLRSSICSVETSGKRLKLTKEAPVISYALDADAILVTCRRSADAPQSDQVMVLLESDQTQLEEFAGWDTLGFRGTCSSGFILQGEATLEQVLPHPFDAILSRSMHPYSHLSWSSVWLGLASNAVNRAREAVRAQARKTPDAHGVSALRLAEVDEILFGMRSGLYRTLEHYEALLAAGSTDVIESFGFSIAVNNVKITCSELVVDIVGRALAIVGISGYRNDSKNSLGRHLRDAYGAALMVNNDRIRGHNSTMQIVHRPS